MRVLALATTMVAGLVQALTSAVVQVAAALVADRVPRLQAAQEGTLGSPLEAAVVAMAEQVAAQALR